MLWKNLPPGSRIIGKDHAAAGSRVATIAFTIDGMSSSAAVKKLVEKDIAVRNGALLCGSLSGGFGYSGYNRRDR